MKKLLLIAKNEYTKHVLQRRFIFTLLSVPLVVTLMFGLIFLIVTMENDAAPVGYIDQAGLLVDPIPAPEATGLLNPTVEMIAFPAIADAEAALDNGEIQAFFVISENYWTGEPIQLIYIKDVGDNATKQFRDFIQVNLMKGHPARVSTVIADGFELVMQSVDGSREFTDSNFMQFLTPYLTGLAFMILMFTSGGYLMAAVVEEKENRTMEIIMTSVSPTQLLGGKIMGIVGITFTQLAAWIVFVVGAIFIGGNVLGLDILQGISFNYIDLFVFIIVLVPAYIMVAALMAMIGSTISEVSEGQQLSAIITLPVMVPYWFTALIMQSPNSPLVKLLSVFPFTAPGTITMRMAFTQVPAEELIITVSLLVASALGSIWLAGRAFRLGMLRYGQKLSLRDIFRKQSAEV